MKKNIEMIDIDAPLLSWLIDRLKAAPTQFVGAEDFLQGASDLLDGVSTSLMLELNSDAPQHPQEHQIHCGALTIYANARRVTRDQQEISLTPKEFDILYFLARNRGEVFTKEQIYQAVWEGSYLLDDSNIMAFIRKIRKKIEPHPDEPIYILTIWGIGYKFNDKL